jgi:hypothetical protein
MPWWAVLCAVIFGILVIPTGLVAFVATIRIFRGLGALARALEARAVALEASTTVLEERGAAAAAAQAAAAEHLAALNASLARLRVLSAGLGDAQGFLQLMRILRTLR